MNRKLWVICIGLWFVIWGILALTNIQFVFSNVVLGLLAIVGGICLFLDR